MLNNFHEQVLRNTESIYKLDFINNVFISINVASKESAKTLTFVSELLR